MATAKLSWDRMSFEAKRDFRMRVEAELHLKNELKKTHRSEKDKKYKPINYYGHFMKEKIEKEQSSDQSKIKINA